MSHTIVDTNVAIVANGKSEQADSACVLATHKFLEGFTHTRNILVIDSRWRILKEYIHNLRSEGQPGVGDAFLKWVLTNQANPHRCEQISITLRQDAQHDDDFIEFPDDPTLDEFDRADRKFVAVAHAHQFHPAIYNAVDTDWYTHQEVLAVHRITVAFVCPDVIQRLVAVRER